MYFFVLNSHFFLHLTHSIVWWDYNLVYKQASKTERERWRKKKVVLALLSLQHQYYISFCVLLLRKLFECTFLAQFFGSWMETHVHSFEFTLSVNSIINCWVKWHSCATICLSTHSSCRKLRRVACHHHHHVRNVREERMEMELFSGIGMTQ